MDTTDRSLERRIILSLLNSLGQNKTPASLETIRSHPMWAQAGKGDRLLQEVLDQLIDGDLICCTERTYALTKTGQAQVKAFMSQGFSAMMMASEQSAVSRKFCKQVYGIDLCQFNMMSQAQLEKLLQVMDLSEDDQVLDLGCGVGRIAEYISDVTRAKVTGVDFAARVIQRAQERTREKSGRLTYRVMDMDDLRLPTRSFSALISIDALHFASDLKRTIQSAKGCLHENGQMGIFYSTIITAKDPVSMLAPDQTRLARALQACGLNYQAWDFTQDEKRVWEKILHTAEELKGEYAAEGNLQIYASSLAEARHNLEAASAGRLSRCLYHVR